MRVLIDRTVCIGAGNCVRLASTVFDQDDEAIVFLLDDSPAPQDRGAVLEAVEMCPGRAISAVED